MYWPFRASTGTVRTPSWSSCSFPIGSFTTSTAVKSMPFFERNSFVLRQLLQPGWVNRVNLSATLSMIVSSAANNDVASSAANLNLSSHLPGVAAIFQKRCDTRSLSPGIQLFKETALVKVVEKAMIDKLLGFRALGSGNRLCQILQCVLHACDIYIGRF